MAAAHGGDAKRPLFTCGCFWTAFGQRHAKDKDRPHLRHQAPSKTATNALGGDVEFQTPCGGNGVACG